MDRAPAVGGRGGLRADEPSLMRGLAAAIVMAVLMCAPACKDTAPSGPPEIRLGADLCDGCGMTIAETRYAAAAIVAENSERRLLKFDDIGCLARWEASAPGSTVQERWVHDRTTEAWIEATTATFSRTPELTTPMGSGITAFRFASDAEVLIANRGGETLSWNAILALAREGSLQRHSDTGQEAAR